MHGIKQQSSRSKSARKKVVTSLFKKKKKKKTKQKKKPKQVKPLVSLCANKNKRTGKGVGTDFFPVHVTFSNYDLLTRGSNQFI